MSETTAQAVENSVVSEATSARPFGVFEQMVALRYLGGRRFISINSVIAVISIAVGVFALIVTMSVMNGFRKDLFDKIIGVNGHIFVQAADEPLTNYEAITDRLSKIQGITMVLPMVESAVGVSSPYNQSGALVRGMREADLKKLPGLKTNIVQGTLNDFDQSGGVVIGQRIAQKLGLQVGDRITLLSARGAQTPLGIVPRMKSYPVVGVFQIGMSEADSSLVYMPLSESQLYFNKANEVNLIEVFVENPEDMSTYRERINAVAGQTVFMTDWREQNKTLIDALKVESTVMFAILSLIIIVAALNIISHMVMLVKDKQGDIAILRTMGAAKGAILRIFLMVGWLIGLLGTLFGSLFGILMAAYLEDIRTFLNNVLHTTLFPSDIYFLSRLPSSIEGKDVFMVVLLALGLALLATIYPAWKAASLDPVEALRYE